MPSTMVKGPSGPLRALKHSLKGLFNDSTYSDLTITCGEDIYHVHKAIVCPRSKFFANAVNGNFKESQASTIPLPDDDPQAVRLMLFYFYHLDYPHVPKCDNSAADDIEPSRTTATRSLNPDLSQENESLFATPVQPLGGSAERATTSQEQPPEPVGPKDPAPPISADDTPNLIIHAQVYALAEKYNVLGLKSLCIHKFCQEAKKFWDTDKFAQACFEVYTSTVDSDEGLRSAVVRTLYEIPAALEREDVQEALRELPMAFDLLMHVRREGCF